MSTLNHSELGEENHFTSSLTSSDPVDIQLKINGIGTPGDSENWSGPQEELTTMHIAPEFGSIVMAIFGVAVLATISLRSKFPSFN